MEGEEKKDNEQEEVHHEYLKEIINKYDFIEAIYITDFDGAVIAQELQKPIENEDESYKKIHGILLAYNFNLSIDQTTKTEKWIMKNVTTIFDNHTIFQNKINKNSFVHFICENDKYNHEVMKEIAEDIKEKMKPIEELI